MGDVESGILFKRPIIRYLLDFLLSVMNTIFPSLQWPPLRLSACLTVEQAC